MGPQKPIFGPWYFIHPCHWHSPTCIDINFNTRLDNLTFPPGGVWSRPCRVPQCRRDQVKGQAARRHDILLPCWPTTGKLKNSENKINTYSLQEQAELPEPYGQLLQHRHHQGLWLIRWKLSIKKLSFIRYSFPVVRWEREMFVEAGRRRWWLLRKIFEWDERKVSGRFS